MFVLFGYPFVNKSISDSILLNSIPHGSVSFGNFFFILSVDFCYHFETCANVWKKSRKIDVSACLWCVCLGLGTMNFL